MRAAVLIPAAFCFAFVNGVNDGGPLVAMGLKVPSLRPVFVIAVLAAAIVVGPLVIGTGVATTLASKLVPFEGSDRDVGLLVAIVVAVAVVGTLARLGLPTSLTLATIGALVGAGAGLGAQVSWSTLGKVAVVGAVAPFVGALAAYVVAAVRDAVPARSAIRRLRRLHYAGFGLECLAYASNDGQRMLAIYALASGTAVGTSGEVPARPLVLVALAAAFALGAALGTLRFARTFGEDLLASLPGDAVTAELAASTAVFGATAVGTPLSMTQTLSGGLIGAASRSGIRRVRWPRALRLVTAWVVTVPVTLGLALVSANVVSRFS